MKKSILLAVSVLLVMTLFVGCGQQSATPSPDAGETYNWRFAHEENNGSIQDVYVKEFVRILEEKSGGKINIDIYPVGQIGDATQQCELLQNGGLEFAMVSPGNTGTIVPENQLFSLHFLFSEDMDKNKEIFKNSKALNEDLTAIYADKNIKVLSYWTEGTMEWTTSKPVNRPELWKGLKMRTMPSPMIVASYEAYGANPTPMPYMEVYSGLQLNMIEGQENPLSAIEEMKFYEVQKYLTLGSSSLYVTTTAVNPKFFDSLPADIQKMILETVEETRDFSFQAQADLNGGALDKIKAASDIEIVTLTQEERELFKEASKSAYDVYKNMVGAKGAAILDKLMAEIAEIEK
ncbi:DctP family TRAP transporter solute-binding subunit [Sedimentibacter hydroxybenzoicus DSM 7310]|uniref:DctP family TRAP transporter solute-binding subunit n=1 Tax=Sedimentibacter hydroxybenzoicus DSM 7310 TaxID=1123245 RepID=A0A974BMU9_SEDHY|nr:DctP family TRAP transporter solute-binding subunit [Sedimentibacter hydroxybenzoicus]NYB75868.1 DctP family TRAP transporter solute-binding subunit [Sedimentibacter hydroxybenzoicus DSM 7310]